MELVALVVVHQSELLPTMLYRMHRILWSKPSRKWSLSGMGKSACGCIQSYALGWQQQSEHGKLAGGFVTNEASTRVTFKIRKCV